MYCPKCSQLQSSDEMRFCPRCGFALAGVAMLVETDGVITPQLANRPGQKLPLSRKRVMVESAIFTAIAWAALINMTSWFDYGGPYESLAKAASVLCALLGLIGLARFLYGFLFVKDLVNQPAHDAFPNLTAQGGLSETPRRAALPGQKDLPASDYQRRHTKDMMPRPSVTENTTRLLEDPPTDRSD